MNTTTEHAWPGDGFDGLTRFVVDGACCYLLGDADTRRCVVIDPLPELTDRIAQLLLCQACTLVAVLDTHSHGDHVSSGPALRAALPPRLLVPGEVDALGWPSGVDALQLGTQTLTRLPVPGHTTDSTAYLLRDAQMNLRLAFVGDTVMPGALGRSDFAQSAPLAFGPSLKTLAQTVGTGTLLLPGHDYDNRFASTMAGECAVQPLLAQVLHGHIDARQFAAAKADLEKDLALTEYQTLACGARIDGDSGCGRSEMDAVEVQQLLQAHRDLVLVDVREPYEQRLGDAPAFGAHVRCEAVPLSGLLNALPGWLSLPAGTPVLFYCRSGNRSSQAAKALRRLGHAQAWSLAGGLALWPGPASSAVAKPCAELA